MNTYCGTQLLSAHFSSFGFEGEAIRVLGRSLSTLEDAFLGERRPLPAPRQMCIPLAGTPPSSAQHVHVFYFPTLRCYQQTPKFMQVMRELADVIRLIL